MRYLLNLAGCPTIHSFSQIIFISYSQLRCTICVDCYTILHTICVQKQKSHSHFYLADSKLPIALVIHSFRNSLLSSLLLLFSLYMSFCSFPESDPRECRILCSHRKKLEFTAQVFFLVIK